MAAEPSPTVPDGNTEYRSDDYHFSVYRPGDIPPEETRERGFAMTAAFQTTVSRPFRYTSPLSTAVRSPRSASAWMRPTSVPPCGSPTATAHRWAGLKPTIRSASPISSATPSTPSTQATSRSPRPARPAAAGLQDRPPPGAARRRHPAGLPLKAQRQTRCAAPHHPDPRGRRKAESGDRSLPAFVVRLPRQPRRPADQQRLRAGAAALRRVPKSHQLLPVRMGRASLRRHPIRHRNRAPPRHRRPRRHSRNPERIAARWRRVAIDGYQKGLSVYNLGTLFCSF